MASLDLHELTTAEAYCPGKSETPDTPFTDID